MSGGAQGSDYWSHLANWRAERYNPNVLIFSFSQILRDPVGHIRRLADFCHIVLDNALLELKLERSSIVYMLENKHQFDDAMMRALSENRLGFPQGSDSAKVREGKTGGHRTLLPQAVADQIDAIWSERILRPFDLADFAAVEATLRPQAA